MSRGVEITAATVAALALHLVVLGYVADRVGAASAGDDGQTLTTLDAAPAVLSALVAAWETPPATAIMPEAALPQPEAPQPPPTLPSPQTAPPSPLRIAALAVPAADTAAAQPRISAPVPPESTAPRLRDPAPAPLPPKMPSTPTTHLPAASPMRPQPPATDAPPRTPAPAIEPAPSQIAPQIAPQSSPLSSPVPQPRPSVARRAQAAAGSGGQGSAGARGHAAAASADQAGTAAAVAVWGADIRARIEARQRFPASATGSGGTVAINLVVARGGALLEVTLASASGNPALDTAALAAARAAAPFAPAPTELAAVQYSFRLAIRFGR